MDRDRPGANRDIGHTFDSRRQNLPDYEPCEAAQAVVKYARYLKGNSVVVLSARDAVSTPGKVTGDLRSAGRLPPFSEAAAQCPVGREATIQSGRRQRATRLGLRVLALLLVVLGMVPNHVMDGGGWTLPVAFAAGWFAGDLWGYSSATFAAVYKTIANRRSLRWNLVLLFTGIAAVLISLLILTHVSEQDWASGLSVVLGWVTGRHYHRCKASFDVYFNPALAAVAGQQGHDHDNP